VLFKIAISIFPDKVGGYLGVVILMTVIFFIPAYLYYKFTKRGRLSSVLNELKIKAPKIDHIFLLFFGAVLISVCVFYINLLFRLREGYTYGFYLYNTFFTGKLPSPDTPLFPIIAFALVPAMCEEFMFRGIFHASYEKQGFMSAAITSSIMFALVSLDIRTFISNFALGLFLSFILYLTRSLVSCFIVNFLFKCFMLFFGTNLQSYVLSSSNKAVFFAATIGTMLISFAVFTFETAKIFKQNSKGEHPLPKLTAPTKRVCFERTASNLSTVSITICVAIFIIAIFI
jgi:membrane protease YdiL (CAAX protease family)